MASTSVGNINGLVTCELKGDTSSADDVVLDITSTTYSALGQTATSMLTAGHELTASGEVKVTCYNKNGDSIGVRKLVAVKVDEPHQ